MNIFPCIFQTLHIKLRTKFSKKLEQKYSQIFPKILDGSKETWQRLKAHTAFFLSRAEWNPEIDTLGAA